MDKGEKIEVTVTYVGKHPWTEAVPPNQPLQAIKVHAMNYFELEAGQQARYVLQYSGADQDGTRKVGDFGVQKVILTLTLVEEPNKG